MLICILKHHWIGLLGLIVFLVETLGLSIYKILSSANRDHFTSSFLIWMPSISFACLLTLARTFSTLLNKSGDSGHSYLIPDLRGKAFNFSPLSMTLVVSLSKWPLLCWGMFLLYSIYWQFLSWNDVEFCQMLFLCVFWDDHLIFMFHSMNVYHISWFTYVDPSLHSRNNSHLILVYDPFSVLLSLVY